MRKNIVLAAAGFVFGCLLLGGCGQNAGAKQIEDGIWERQEETEEAETEENSLAEWEKSLAEGDPEAFCAEAVRGVSVARRGEVCFAVSYEPRPYKNSFDCWAISSPYRSMAVVDTEAMYKYFGILADMKLAPAEITEEQAGTENSENTLFVAYYSGQTAEGGQAEPDRGILFRFGGEDAEGKRYVEAAGKLWSVDSGVVDDIFGIDPYTCVLKVVSVVNVETVSAVEIETGEGRYVMQASQGAFRLGEKTVESGVFYELYTELMSIFLEKEIPGKVQEKAERELLMRITYERNMEDAPRITQEYYVYDDTYAAVEVNGTSFFLVSREALEKLQERIAAAF